MPRKCTNFFSAATVVGLEDVAYEGLENIGTIEVCAAIFGNCTASFTFFLSLSTSDDTAGEYNCLDFYKFVVLLDVVSTDGLIIILALILSRFSC